MQHGETLQTEPPRRLGKTEFIILISAIMMIVAFAIDSMLPAFPAIGEALKVSDPNDRPQIISIFLLGFGVAQLFVGILSDRFGRRGIVIWSLLGFVLTSIGAALASSFESLLALRFVQGVFCAGARVVVTSIVRDQFEGREMAQVMSLSSMLFMAAPILAPSMGQMVLLVAPWRWIFGALAMLGLGLWAWVTWRLPESLAVKDRIPIDRANIIASVRTVAGDRMSVGYSIAMGAISCGLFGFLTSVQQIFDITFNRADLLPIGFAIMASGMAVASLLNATIVRRYGMRRIGHWALIWFTAIAGVHAAVALSGRESLESFIILQMAMMMGFALVAGNFSAMAMENMGSVAGMASSLQGSIPTIAGSVFGAIIGYAFDGTTAPLYVAMLLSGLVALAAVLITEKGRLFVARHDVAQGR